MTLLNLHTLKVVSTKYKTKMVKVKLKPQLMPPNSKERGIVSTIKIKYIVRSTMRNNWTTLADLEVVERSL